jgi:hypothetical protein
MHTESFGGGTDTHDFAHGFDVGDAAAADEFDIGDLRGASGSQSQSQGHRETWGGAGF